MADFSRDEVAYDYGQHSWVDGIEAVPILVEQYVAELATLRDNGLDFLNFCRPASRSPATAADLAAAIAQAEAALAYWRGVLEDEVPF